jgi:hypothetical protein
MKYLNKIAMLNVKTLNQKTNKKNISNSKKNQKDKTYL